MSDADEDDPREELKKNLESKGYKELGEKHENWNKEQIRDHKLNESFDNLWFANLWEEKSELEKAEEYYEYLRHIEESSKTTAELWGWIRDKMKPPHIPIAHAPFEDYLLECIEWCENKVVEIEKYEFKDYAHESRRAWQKHKDLLIRCIEKIKLQMEIDEQLSLWQTSAKKYRDTRS